jgi:bacillithiol biosynthesis cysteine-adding enzyme BshC
VGRTFSSSYLADAPAARARALPFLARDFRDPSVREAATHAAAARGVNPGLVEVLREQQARLPPCAARDASLAALAGGQTAVVATGQQVGLFLGPLYSFYKAATAVAAARALEAEAGVRCVPLFWLQTEDHDFDEIAACHVAGEDGAPVTLRLPAEPVASRRVSIAHRRLGPEIVALVDALGAALGADGEEVIALVRAHYRPERTLAQAFAGLLAAIFAGDGLLVLDPREARVAALAAPVYRRALDEADVIEAGLRARGAALEAAGFDEQIPVRAECSLVFFHEREAAGPRFRLRRGPDRDHWALAGAGDLVGAVELRRCLEREPLRLSTSALLRPLVQDTLLPTAAYVGGPAEVSYFAQLGPLYETFGLPPPLVLPRARFRVVDAATRRRLQQLGLSADDAAAPRHELLARLAPVEPDEGAPDALRRAVAERIAPAVDDVTRAALAGDAGLARAAARTRATVDRALGRFIARYARERGARDGVAAARLDKVQRALAPGGVPQERFYGWPSLAARHGAATLKRLVLERLAAAPFATTLQELTP